MADNEISDEVMMDCLVKKIRGQPLPIDLPFYEENMWDCHPQHLTETYGQIIDENGILYIFTPRPPVVHPTLVRINRCAGEGGWIPTNLTDDYSSWNSEGEVIEIHKWTELAYYIPATRTYTNWMMDEYRISENSQQYEPHRCPEFMKLGRRTLCKIYRGNPDVYDWRANPFPNVHFV